MALRDKSKKQGPKNHSDAPESSIPLGAVRRAQLLTTYGVGAMVAFEDQSFIVSGLDSWNVVGRPDIRDIRLQRHLKVKGFRLPPASDPPSGDGVRVRRFPRMYSCVGCEHNLRSFEDFNPPPGKSECAVCGKPLTPSRFVVACEYGHLDDFPYHEWVHNDKDGRTVPQGPNHRLSLHTTGRTTALRSIVIKCSCRASASMEGAFGRFAMRDIKVSCGGGRPWLGQQATQTGCPLPPRTLQRGSSAAWFPLVRSALTIPPWNGGIHILINDQYDILKHLDDETMASVAEKVGILENTGYSAEDLVIAVRQRQEIEDEHVEDDDGQFESAGELRRDEYKKLVQTTYEGPESRNFECVRPSGDSSSLRSMGIEQNMLVKRLREVRVLKSFVRVEAPTLSDPDNRKAHLSLGRTDWLPAIEVIGEGVFLRLNDDRLTRWEKLKNPTDRAKVLCHNHTINLRQKTALSRQSPPPESPLTSRFILLHTLAHALVNEWSLDAGYPAAALRERLYVSDNMAGVLIYTATSDSAGSLGGLVAQGEPHRLKSSLESALERISWCSADPLCMEAAAGGADSLNLAACHACVLIPETSCETNNTFLDRALLIGTPDNPETGYFRDWK
ncbi:DrmB family protein [Streptosporangium amethystogenes]|uniref:DrmB family protein n=1 Tax=Streptosporangium amethystogenes TaxID=2002 RepID=UPI00378B66D3